jgi:hypothetical protein
VAQFPGCGAKTLCGLCAGQAVNVSVAPAYTAALSAAYAAHPLSAADSCGCPRSCGTCVEGVCHANVACLPTLDAGALDAGTDASVCPTGMMACPGCGGMRCQAADAGECIALPCPPPVPPPSPR